MLLEEIIKNHLKNLVEAKQGGETKEAKGKLAKQLNEFASMHSQIQKLKSDLNKFLDNMAFMYEQTKVYFETETSINKNKDLNFLELYHSLGTLQPSFFLFSNIFGNSLSLYRSLIFILLCG